MDNSNQGRGTVIQWTNDLSANVAAGALVALGDHGLVGVAVHDIADGAAGSVMIPPGVIFDYPVIGHNPSGDEGSGADLAVAVYDKVYFDPAAGTPLIPDSTETLAGFALAAVGEGDTATIPVLLDRA